MLVNERGVTLAEILVAVAVIGIGLVGLLAVVPLATYGVQEGNQLSTATFLAEQRLEQVRNAVWDEVKNLDCLGVGPTAAPTTNTCDRGSCTLGAACTPFPDEPTVTGYPGYARTVRVIDCGTTACGGVLDSGLRLAVVSVSYLPMTGTGVASNTKTIRLSLLIARRR